MTNHTISEILRKYILLAVCQNSTLSVDFSRKVSFEKHELKIGKISKTESFESLAYFPWEIYLSSTAEASGLPTSEMMEPLIRWFHADNLSLIIFDHLYLETP